MFEHLIWIDYGDKIVSFCSWIIPGEYDRPSFSWIAIKLIKTKNPHFERVF